MAVIKADRVAGYATCTGTGVVTLDGTVPSGGFRAFSAVMGATGSKATILIVDQTTPTAWEICEGTWNSSGSGTFTRNATVKASATGSQISFATGTTKLVVLTPSASDVATTDYGLNMSARVDVASASTCNIGAAASNHIRITGTTTITAFDAATAGYWRWLEFEGAVTVTHDGTNIDIYGGASVTTQAKMMALAIYETSSLVRLWFFPGPSATAANVRTGTNNFNPVSAKSLMDAAAPVSVSYAATVTLDMTTGFNWEIGALTNNLTLANPSAGIDPGRSGWIGLRQDGTGGRTITLGSYWKHVGGAPTLSTGANKQDTLYYHVVDSTHIRCSLSKDFS